MRGVLDTSVLFAGLRSGEGPGSYLINAARVAQFDLAVSQYLLDELLTVLIEDFGLQADDAQRLVDLIDNASDRVEPHSIVARCRDPRDDPVLALAEASQSDFLATYDHDIMQVGSVGNCGIVHPQTAVEIVSAATAAAREDEEIPGVSNEDRSRWRYEDGGPALFAAQQFIAWIHQLPANVDVGQALTTSSSWSRWRLAAIDGTLSTWIAKGWGTSVKVRYPADGMAYVLCLPMHPEETAPKLISGPSVSFMEVITLLAERDQWKVFSLGRMIAPNELGLTAYSW